MFMSVWVSLCIMFECVCFRMGYNGAGSKDVWWDLVSCMALDKLFVAAEAALRCLVGKCANQHRLFKATNSKCLDIHCTNTQ